MKASEALAIFRAALLVVEPDASREDAQVSFDSGGSLMEWANEADPRGAALVARLSPRKRDDVLLVLDGMLRAHRTAAMRREPGS